MFQNIIGSIAKAIPGLNASSSDSSSAAPAGKPQGGGLGGLIDQFVAPVASVAMSATKAASSVVDQFIPPVAKSLIGSVTEGLSGGRIAGGLRVEVNVLKSVVATQQMDPSSKAKIQGVLDQVKDGKPLNECLSQLSEQEKTLLADTIGNHGFEPPEALSSYLTNKSQGDSGRMDCALKNVEVAEEHGYQATEASALFRFLPLAAPLLGG
jgi:hypothetical protein